MAADAARPERRRRHAAATRGRCALAGLVLLAGCGSNPAPAPPRAGQARASPAPAPAEPAHRILRFRASDGRRLRGRLTRPERSRAPAVVLVHGLYGEPSQWDALVGDLHRAGFATLAYASRRDDEVDPTVLARDVVGAVRALRRRPQVDRDRILLVGASVGGSAVAYALGTRPHLPVLGGVGISARRVVRPGLGAFRPHDLLLISDHREAETARAVRADAHGRGVTIHLTETTGHGSQLLADAGVRARALAWLEQVAS